MTTLNVNTIKPAGATLTLGESGDSVVLADDVKVNLVKDAGANTLWSSNGSGVLSSVKVGLGGADKLLSTQTVTNQASVSFTSGIDSTYKEYVFKFYNINPATDQGIFQFQVNATDDPGGDYDVSLITSTYFRAYHFEDDVTSGGAGVGYVTSLDQAQAAGFQSMTQELGNGSDESCAGVMHLFSPASTTYVKHFYARISHYLWADSHMDSYISGYINDTTAIDDIQFKMSTGNFDGTIKMWGVKQ